VREETGPEASRNALQTVTLLDALKEYNVDCALGGGRRDEEKARAKERFFSHRDAFGQWDPKNQRPELWSLFNGRKNTGRAFPCVSAEQLDRDGYLAVYCRRADSHPIALLFPQAESVSTGVAPGWTTPNSSPAIRMKRPEEKIVRFRTIGDVTCTGAVLSHGVQPG
jgi:sulfate adenylyltransferase subunit 2